MKRVIFTQTFADERDTFIRDRTHDLPDADADRMIAGGVAKLVKQPKQSKDAKDETDPSAEEMK